MPIVNKGIVDDLGGGAGGHTVFCARQFHEYLM
jgi:hypothetical protein